jgi:hypothetical protein
MRNYWRSLKQTRKFSAEQLPAEFPEFKDSKQWLGKTPVTLVNEYIQGNKQLSVEYERVSTNDMVTSAVHTIRLYCMYLIEFCLLGTAQGAHQSAARR